MPRFRAPAISALLGLALPVQAARIEFRLTGEVTEVPDNPQLEALGVVLGATELGVHLRTAEAREKLANQYATSSSGNQAGS